MGHGKQWFPTTTHRQAGKAYFSSKQKQKRKKFNSLLKKIGATDNKTKEKAGRIKVRIARLATSLPILIKPNKKVNQNIID